MPATNRTPPTIGCTVWLKATPSNRHPTSRRTQRSVWLKFFCMTLPPGMHANVYAPGVQPGMNVLVLFRNLSASRLGRCAAGLVCPPGSAAGDLGCVEHTKLMAASSGTRRTSLSGSMTNGRDGAPIEPPPGVARGAIKKKWFASYSGEQQEALLPTRRPDPRPAQQGHRFVDDEPPGGLAASIRSLRACQGSCAGTAEANRQFQRSASCIPLVLGTLLDAHYDRRHTERPG